LSLFPIAINSPFSGVLTATGIKYGEALPLQSRAFPLGCISADLITTKAVTTQLPDGTLKISDAYETHDGLMVAMVSSVSPLPG
jgi:hypothetical protein